MPPIRGLILAGGFSRRMGRDKATIVIGGQTLLQRTVNLLEALELPVIVSARADQEFIIPGSIRVDDPVPSIGPAGGLLAAMKAHPNTALLTLAVDLPRLGIQTLQQLIEQRHPSSHVTAFENPEDGRIDPLCTLYEPASNQLIQSAVEQGERSLRRILERTAHVRRVQPAFPAELIDLDTPDSVLNLETCPTMSTLHVTIRYFAQLREQRGLTEETIRTDAVDANGLFLELTHRHEFTLPRESLKVAINDAFASWDSKLANGDTVVFLPPVAGG
jgi:molybdopterin-guanine dinucleotide biosynthesis protein A